MPRPAIASPLADSFPLAPPRGGLWTGRQIYLLALLLAASVFAYADRLVLPLLQELVKPELKLSDGELGLATGPAFALFYALSGLPISRLAERFDRVRLLAGAVTLWSAMTAACGAVWGLPSLLVARLGVGFGEGGCVPVSHSLLSEHFPTRQRGLAMSVLSTGAPLAGVLMPVVASTAAHVWGWRAAFVILGVAGALLALLIALTLRDPRTTGATPTYRVGTFWADLGWLFGNPGFAWLFVAGALMGIGKGGFQVFLPSYVMRVHHLTLVQAGGVIAMNGAAGLAGTFLGGWLADRFAGQTGRSYPIVCCAGGLAAGALYLLALGQSAWALTLPLLLAAGFASDMKTGPNYAAVQNVVPARMRATAAAVFMVAATLVGSSVGPAVAGFVSDHFAAVGFPAAMGSFLHACPGGHAPAGAPAAMAQACVTASASGLSAALSVVAAAFLGSGVAFLFCSRFYRTHPEA